MQRSHWDEHPSYPVSDWQSEVANDDTRLGYRDWYEAQIEAADYESQIEAAAETPPTPACAEGEQRSSPVPTAFEVRVVDNRTVGYKIPATQARTAEDAQEFVEACTLEERQQLDVYIYEAEWYVEDVVEGAEHV